MSRVSKINKHAKYRRAQFAARKRREEIQRARNPEPEARSSRHLTPKRLAAKRKRESHDVSN